MRIWVKEIPTFLTKSQANEDELRHRKKHFGYVSYFLTADKQNQQKSRLNIIV